MDEVEKINLLPHENEWKSFRFRIVAFLMIGAVCFICRPLKPVILYPSFPRLVLILSFITGLVLLNKGYFDYQRAVWSSENLQATPETKEFWQRWTLGMALVTLLIAAVVPPFPPLGSILGNRLVHSMENKTPFTNNLTTQMSEMRSQGKLSLRGNSKDQVAQIYFAAVLLMIVGTVIFIGTLITIGIGYLCYKYGLAEVNKWRGLPRIFIECYLGWRNFWRRLKQRTSKTTPAVVTFITQDDNMAWEETAKRKTYFWGRGGRAIIRRGYFRLMEAARNQGITRTPSQSPQEMGEQLAVILPEEHATVSDLTGDYHQARYGPAEPSPERVQTFERVRKALGTKLKYLKGK